MAWLLDRCFLRTFRLFYSLLFLGLYLALWMLYNPCLLSMQIYFDKVTEWALTQSGSTLFRQALASLEIDPGLHPLVPFFTSFIAEEVCLCNPTLLVLTFILTWPHFHYFFCACNFSRLSKTWIIIQSCWLWCVLLEASFITLMYILSHM